MAIEGGLQPSVASARGGSRSTGLFGTYRFFLANLVLVSHLWFGPLGNAGGMGVFAFFVLSGYLMTKQLNTKYRHEHHGLFRYLVNRAVRIYPTYWVVVLLAIIGLALVPGHISSIATLTELPQTAWEWAVNLGIFGLVQPDFRGTEFPPYSRQFVFQMNSVNIELVFYVVMIATTRTARTAMIWLALSVAYAAWLLIAGFGQPGPLMDWGFRSILAGSLPFSLGCVIWYASVQWPVKTLPKPYLLGLAAAAFLVFIFPLPHIGTHQMQRELFIPAVYLSLVVSVAATMWLASIKRACIRPQLLKLDDFLGNISYPLFLCHQIVAALIAALIPGVWRGAYDLAFMLSVIPGIYVVSTALYFLVEYPISNARRRRTKRLHESSLA